MTPIISSNAYAFGNKEQNIKTEVDVNSRCTRPDLIDTVAKHNELNKTTRDQALIIKKLFTYYKTTFLTGEQREADFNFDNIRQYAKRAAR